MFVKSCSFSTDIFENLGGFGGFSGFSHSGRSRGHGTPGNPTGTMEFEDIAFGGSRAKQDPPIEYDLNVTFEELYTGTKKKMKVWFFC